MICTKCSPVQVANDAIADARSVCMREYATAPEVSVYGDPRFTFAYVPSHLHHMTFELVRLLSNPLHFINLSSFQVFGTFMSRVRELS